MDPERLSEIRDAAYGASTTEPTPTAPRRRSAKKGSSDLREQALRELEPLAIAKLREQLEHPDPRVVQAAAKIILEHKWGRATTRQEAPNKKEYTKVIYQTAAAPGGKNEED